MNQRTVDAFTFDLVHGSISRVIWRGEATVASVRALREFGAAAVEEAEAAVTMALVDATEATGFSRDARKELIELGREKPWDRVAFVGMRFEVKVLMELISRALEIMKMDTAKLTFVGTEAEGLAWLEAGPASRRDRQAPDRDLPGSVG